jgi:hypothetical protein
MPLVSLRRSVLAFLGDFRQVKVAKAKPVCSCRLDPQAKFRELEVQRFHLVCLLIYFGYFGFAYPLL